MRTITITLSSILLGLVAQAEGNAVFTNRWISATGGSWTDGSNWQDPEMIGTNDATRAFFDLSALSSGETIVVPRVDEGRGVQTYGFSVGSASGVETDTWLFTKGDEYKWEDVCFRFYKQPNPVDLAIVEVGSGLLRIAGKLSGNVTVKKIGAGVLRPTENVNQIGLRLTEGKVNVVERQVLVASAVNLYSPGAGLTFADYLSDFFVKSLDSTTGTGTPLDLQGRHIRFNGMREDTTLYHNLIAGAGVVSASSCCSLTFKKAQTGFKGTYRLGMGDLVFSTENLCALYRFNDVTAPGTATKIGTALTAVGSVSVVDDDERGSVLSLDGSGHLAAPDATKLPEGLCTGKGDYTVASWIRIVNGDGGHEQATVFYIGKWDYSGKCNLLRLHKDSGSGKRGVMYTNYSNNRTVANDVTEVLYDGGWHHLAVTHGDGVSRLWIDGETVDEYPTSANVEDGEFWIGYGHNNHHFKGRIDDFAFFSTALDATRMAELKEGTLFDQLFVAPLPENSIEAVQSGAMLLETEATVATLTGLGPRSEISLNGDLVVQGSARTGERTTFGAGITGTGDFVKKGADYDLTLTGANAYTGATRVVEGTLTVAGPRQKARGLMGHWTFENAKSPGEDSSGNGFDLSVNQVAVVEDAERGRVAAFNGSGQLSSLIYPLGFPSGGESYTVSLWLKGASSCAENGGVVFWGEGTDHRCVFFRLDGTHGWVMTNWGNNKGGTEGGTFFRDETWHHVVWVREGRQNTVYVDGVVKDAWETWVDMNVRLMGTEFKLGHNPAAGTAFTGWMDDVRVYNTALSADEAMAEFQGGIPEESYKVAEDLPDPVYRWTFEDETQPGLNSGTATDGLLETEGPNVKCSEGMGRPGKVLDLTGDTTSYLKATTFPSLCPTGADPWTVTFWERMDPSCSSDGAMVYWGDPDTQFALLGFHDGNGRFRVTYQGGSDIADAGFDLKPRSARARWHHVAARWDGLRVSIFIDGSYYVSSSGGPANIGDKFFWIGRKASSETAWFKGCLDDVRIYDRALSVGMIRQMIREDLPSAVLPEETDVEVAEGAEFVVSLLNQRVRSLTGAGTVRVEAGAKLAIAEPDEFDGRLDLASPACLDLPAGTMLKAASLTLDGANRSGVFTCGAGTLMVGNPGTMLFIR